MIIYSDTLFWYILGIHCQGERLNGLPVRSIT
jgi:hypothetical protein